MFASSNRLNIINPELGPELKERNLNFFNQYQEVQNLILQVKFVHMISNVLGLIDYS